MMPKVQTTVTLSKKEIVDLINEKAKMQLPDGARGNAGRVELSIGGGDATGPITAINDYTATVTFTLPGVQSPE